MRYTGRTICGQYQEKDGTVFICKTIVKTNENILLFDHYDTAPEASGADAIKKFLKCKNFINEISDEEFFVYEDEV